jgi:uncharacterized protein YggT (Ycf19 family)
MSDTNRALYRSTQFVWYILYVIETLLIFRFALKLFGANAAASFANFIYNISSFFLAPFRLVFKTESVAGSVVEWSTLLAVFVYWLLAWGIVELLVMNRSISTYEAERGLQAQDNL